MQANGTLSIEDAWRYFLLRFPQTWDNYGDFESFVMSQAVLFGVQNNMLFLKDMHTAEPAAIVPPEYNPMYQMPPLHVPPVPLMSTTDFASETEAVKYFQRQISRRSEKWVPIKSLAGHLSQASAHVRAVVGPQSDFVFFLLRHSRIFEVQGDLVSLRDELKLNFLPRQASQRTARRGRPMSMFVPSNPCNFQGSSGISDYLNISQPVPPLMQNLMQLSPPPSQPPSQPTQQQSTTQNILVTLVDYFAVMWLRHTIENISNSQAQGVHLQTLMQEFITAPESIRNTIGWTQIEVTEFIKKFVQLFEVNDNMVKNKSLDRSNTTFIIADSNSANANSISLINKKGVAFCVSKSWGIIDLGQHEHVFFDRSLFKHVGDLTKHFTVSHLNCMFSNPVQRQTGDICIAIFRLVPFVINMVRALEASLHKYPKAGIFSFTWHVLEKSP